MRKSVFMSGLLVTAAGGMLAAGTVAHAAEAPENPWWIGARLQVRGGMDLKVSGGSYSQIQGVHATALTGRDPDSVGHMGEYANRTYKDGSVFIDPGTAHPDTIEPGLTWYWRYENASQYGADTLTFHGSDGARQTVSVLQNGDLSDSTDEKELGVVVTAGRKIGQWGNARIDLCAELGLIPSASANLAGQTYSEQIVRERYDVVDTYRLSGVIPPQAPYEGTYEGPGPLIPNVPESRARNVFERRTWTAQNRIGLDADWFMASLRLGPRIQMDVSRSMTVYAMPALSANFVDMNIERTERFVTDYDDGVEKTLRSWVDSKSKSGWLFGASVTAGVQMELPRGIFAGLFGSWEWMTDDIEVHVGPNTVTLDPGGYSVGAEVGMRL